MSQGARVTVIPSRVAMYSRFATAEQVKRRVAAYARVSTDDEEQQKSYAAQVAYYTDKIKSNDDWIFVDVYADEAKSGTSTKHRKDFNRMIQDALDGKIDLILTKSASRFARNTVDSLTTIRLLKEKGVEIFFEREGIYSLDAKGELLITLMSSLAQEESRSISENVSWGKRKSMADGKVSMSYKSFLGFEKGPDNKPKIVESEAKIILDIVRWFLQGMTYSMIAAHLTELGVPTPRGKKIWPFSTVKSILMNEKYCGQAVLQKTFTTDFLTKKSKVNEGELPKYYVTDSHPAIYPPAVYALVQEEIKRREAVPVKSGLGVFARRVICGECGGLYGPKVWHSSDKYRRVVFQCNEKYGSGKRCATPHVTEAVLKEAFVVALNRMIGDRAAVIADIRMLLPMLADTSALRARLDRLCEERDELHARLQFCVMENAESAIDQTKYQPRFDELASRYENAQAKIRNVEERIRQRAAKHEMLTYFVEELEQRPNLIAEFDDAAWFTLADRVTITGDGGAVFRFKNGQDVRVDLRDR